MQPFDLRNLISVPASEGSAQRVAPNITKPRRTVVTGSFKYAHTLFDRCARVAFVVWRVDAGQEGDVDAEVVLRKRLRFPDGFPKRVRRRLSEGSEYA